MHRNTSSVAVDRICIVGLGKLGAPLAAVLANKGFNVVGVDRNLQFVHAINAGDAPVQEPNLREFIAAGHSRLRATDDFEAAVASSDVTFVIVPTPSGKNGAFSNHLVLAAMEKIGEALRSNSKYHVVAIVSTVMPGSTDGEIKTALERHSGRLVGHDVGLCYNPEFIALGSVITDMLRPDMILIGESDSRAGNTLAWIYSKVCENTPSVQRMSLINAEVTKVAVNTFVTTKISYANMLADICERLPGADANVVTAAIGRDSRIGTKYLRAAVGFGGPCFPRDNVAFVELARQLGARADLAQATHAVNEHQIDRLVDKVCQQASAPATIGILGLSYKPDTGVIEQSTGVTLATRLAEHGFQIVVFDPVALGAAVAILGDRAMAAESAKACVAMSDVVVIVTAWSEFRDLPIEVLRRPGRRLPIIDCWRLLEPDRFDGLVDFIYVGKAPA